MAQVALTTEEVRKMQIMGLEMTLFFDEFCKKHNLTYYFCGGCCIGSIRNGGFIPWDDDVDVFMPRGDYEKLKQLWVDTPQYSIQYTTKDVLTENQFLTICDNTIVGLGSAVIKSITAPGTYVGVPAKKIGE